MRYFITGTAGFIGFNVARRLLDNGHDVTGFDGMTPYYSLKLKEARNNILCRYDKFQSKTGMIEDREALQRAIEQARPDIIIHLAAQAGVRYSLENPKAYLDSNLVGSFNIIELAKELKVRHLLMASTSSVYGGNSKIPFCESDKADEPMTFYAASKKAMEVMAHSYAHLYKVPTTIFRFFTVYGPWGRPDMALFKFVKAIENHQEINIYGEGRMSRDFTYIDDLVEAVVRLVDVVPDEKNRLVRAGIIDSLSTHAPFRIVNIGASQPVELLDFIDAIERAMGVTAKRQMLPMQQGDVARTFANCDLLEALTAYKPSTSLDQGVRAFVQWYRQEGQSIG